MPASDEGNLATQSWTVTYVYDGDSDGDDDDSSGQYGHLVEGEVDDRRIVAKGERLRPS